MRKIRIYLFTLVAAMSTVLLVTGCGKKSEVDCTYHLRTFIQYEKGGTNEPIPGVIGYVFLVHGEQWELTDSEEAIQGILTDIETGEKISADKRAVSLESGELYFPGIKQKRFIVMVYDDDTKLFAWKNAVIAEDISQVTVNIVFTVWDETLTKDTSWTAEIDHNVLKDIKGDDGAIPVI